MDVDQESLGRAETEMAAKVCALTVTVVFSWSACGAGDISMLVFNILAELSI